MVPRWINSVRWRGRPPTTVNRVVSRVVSRVVNRVVSRVVRAVESSPERLPGRRAMARLIPTSRVVPGVELRLQGRHPAAPAAVREAEQAARLPLRIAAAPVVRLQVQGLIREAAARAVELQRRLGPHRRARRRAVRLPGAMLPRARQVPHRRAEGPHPLSSAG